MTVTATSFRSVFREFKDPQLFDDSVVGFWITTATDSSNGPALLDPTRWGPQLDLGVMLYVAHNLAIGADEQASAAVGGALGRVQGPVTAKAVDKVSGSYDATRVTFEDAPYWNLTKYGIRFLQLARMIGAGGIYIS